MVFAHNNVEHIVLIFDTCSYLQRGSYSMIRLDLIYYSWVYRHEKNKQKPIINKHYIHLYVHLNFFDMHNL